MSFTSQTLVLLKKEIKLELRSKTAFFSLLLYLTGLVFTCYMGFHLKTSNLGPVTWNTLFWIIMLFIGINGIAKSFAGEPKGREYYYYFVAKPEAFVFAKMIYNVGLMLILGFAAFFIMRGVLSIEIENPVFFAEVLVLGCLGFAATLTLVSGIVSKTNNPMLMALLSFPVIIPLLLLLIRTSGGAIEGLAPSLYVQDLASLAGINMLVIAATYLLFPYLWRA